MFATILRNYKFFREESVPRVPPRMRGCDQAVQNTHVVYYTVGIKGPAASFFNWRLSPGITISIIQSCLHPMTETEGPNQSSSASRWVVQTGGLSGCMLTPEG
jgi:hypothetical protein